MGKEDIRRKFQKEGEELSREVREKTLGYLLAGFGVIAGIAWNDAIRVLIDNLFPLTRDTILAKFVYATLMTLVVVLISVYTTRLLSRKNNTTEQK